MRTALLLGATGLTGSHCLKLLLNDNTYEKVTLLTRRPLPVTHDKLEQHVIDFEKLDEFAEFIKADDVFCCMGTTIKKAGSKEAFLKVDVEYTNSLARIASENLCKQFLVISAPESNPDSPFFYGRAKAEMEKAICTHSFSGIYIFRPSLLMGTREHYRLAEGLGIKLMTMLSKLPIKLLKKIKPINAEAVAKAMLVAAKSAPGGKRIYSFDQIQTIADSGQL